MRARFARIVQLIEEKCLERVGEPQVKTYKGPHYGNSAEGPERDFTSAVCNSGRERMVIVRVFAKKPEKTPRREIELALTRAKSVCRIWYRGGWVHNHHRPAA